MRILIDQDDVMADFNGYFVEVYRQRHPDMFYVPADQVKEFKLTQNYPEDLRGLVEDICREPGFFANLPPMEGALEAILELSKTPNEIFICTAPYLANPTCTDDKLYWIGKHLGKGWKNRTIITSDKTVVQGDMLIDDKPEITGVQTPIWEQVLYTQPYNLHITDKRRVTWKDWKSVLNL